MNEILHQLSHHPHAGIVFALLLIYQLKHFLADYPLQGAYMLGKFKDHGWVLPLAAHCAVHGWFTFAIAMAFGMKPLQCLGLAAFDFVVHFTMDRIKASPKLMGRWKALSGREYVTVKENLAWYSPFRDQTTANECRAALRNNKLFWWALGFDQMVHHLTHYAIIAYIACNR